MAATGSAAAAAAFLAACGGGDDDGDGGGSGSTGGNSSGLEYTPVDSTSQAKAGGTLKHYAAADIAHFDALASNSASTVNFGSVFAYNRLLKFKSGKYPDVADGTSEGEMAESWEVSPDKLTLTMKLRQGNGTKWDDRAPTNGRAMDMDDVLYSYKKFAEVNPSGANVANSRNPLAPVVSVTASDPRTLVIKLNKPDATVIGLFSATDHLYIMPREAEGGFDPKTEVRGNGPWLLQEYTPSTRFVWKKNPNYYVTGPAVPGPPGASDHHRARAAAGPVPGGQHLHGHRAQRAAGSDSAQEGPAEDPAAAAPELPDQPDAFDVVRLRRQLAFQGRARAPGVLDADRPRGLPRRYQQRRRLRRCRTRF